MTARRVVLSLISGGILLSTATGVGQQFTRTEIGFDTSILPGNRFSSVTEAGVGTRFTYNFTSSIALDSELDPYLTKPGFARTSLQFGGWASLFVIGPKAGIRARKYGVFFKARPGFMSFSNAFASGAIFGSQATTRKTHAALDLGIASELYASTRTILRLDFGTLLVRYGDATLFSTPGLTIRTQGRIDAPWHIAMGIGYRMGSVKAAEESLPSPRPQRFQAGGDYSLMTLERSAQTIRDESAIGGWFTWNFSRYAGLDGSANFFPRQVKFADFQQGGRILQALAGARAGVRRNRLGVFAKFRPGVQLYTVTVQNETTQNLPHFTDIAFDMGGIIEVYTSKHMLLRFDAGNTVVHYRSRDIISFEGQAIHIPGFTTSTIQLTSGFGFQF